MTDVYLRLTYREYKWLEAQLRDWEQVETTHVSVDGFYHKALRLDIGDLALEIQGPAVKAPYREDEPHQVGDTVMVGGVKFTKIAEDPFGAESPPSPFVAPAEPGDVPIAA